MTGTSFGQGGTYVCANCEIAFDWTPAVQAERTYCCTGCAAGGPCTCDYASLSRPEAAPGAVRPLAYTEAGRKEGR